MPGAAAVVRVDRRDHRIAVLAHEARERAQVGEPLPVTGHRVAGAGLALQVQRGLQLRTPPLATMGVALPSARAFTERSSPARLEVRAHLHAPEPGRGDVGEGRSQGLQADRADARHVLLIKQVIGIHGNRNRHPRVADHQRMSVRLVASSVRNAGICRSAVGLRVGIAAPGPAVGILQREVDISPGDVTDHVVDAAGQSPRGSPVAWPLSTVPSGAV